MKRFNLVYNSLIVRNNQQVIVIIYSNEIYENIVLQDVDSNFHEIARTSNNHFKGKVSFSCKNFLYHDMTTIGDKK